MATFTFRKRKLDKIRVNIASMPGAKVWFQPTHHGGCIQVFKDEDHFKNVFCNSRTGYEYFCHDVMAINDCKELPQDWVDSMVQAQLVVFGANYHKDKGQVKITMRWKKLT